MSAVSELEHVLVLCTDIEATREFYEGAVGLRAGDRPPLQFDGYWLYAGDTPCLHIADRAQYAAHAQTLGLAVDAVDPAGAGGSDRAGGPGTGGGAVDHIAFSAADYDAVNARLAAAGIEPVRNDVPGGGPRQLFFDDPDGLRVEINIRR
jgi:catechol 2,3-dioxygenase-like lactoylglutathione lyase family enzyme